VSRIIATISFVGLLAIAPAAARADECFCLSHAEGAVLRGCEAFTSERGEMPTALCTDPLTGKKSVQKLNPEWRRIEAGADRCDVCRPTPRGTSTELPRREDDARGQRQ
jgi:hypothetical protein